MADNVTLITTFNATLWNQYAQRCLDSWAAHLPRSVELIVYGEGNVGRGHDWLWRNLQDHVPYRDFLTAHPVQGQRDFRHDVRRFCHKIFTVAHAASHCTTRYLVWLDADVFCFENIPDDFFPSLFDGKYMFYLGRHGYTHSECGCYGFDTTQGRHPQFPLGLEALYTSGEVMSLPESHDSFVTDWLRKRQEQAGLITAHNLTSHVPKGHAWLASPLALYLDHQKGNRWKTQKSWKEDVSSLTAQGVKLNISHPYWRHMPNRTEV